MWFKKQNKINEDEILNAVTKFKGGSAEAFKILYDVYGQKVYRYCLRLLSDPDLANDCFQETFVKVYENRQSFKGISFPAWLFRIAHNTCMSSLRNRKNTEEIQDVYFVNDNFGNDDFALKREIKNAIDKLPKALKEAILLREYEDLSYNEIAEVLSIDVSLAKVRVFRARVQLKSLLKPLIKELNES